MPLVLFNLLIGTLSGATTPGQSGPGSDGNKEVLLIPQSFSITGISPSDCSVLYPGHSLRGGAYPSADVQSVYSTAPANWAIILFISLEFGGGSPFQDGMIVVPPHTHLCCRQHCSASSAK